MAAPTAISTKVTTTKVSAATMKSTASSVAPAKPMRKDRYGHDLQSGKNHPSCNCNSQHPHTNDERVTFRANQDRFCNHLRDGRLRIWRVGLIRVEILNDSNVRPAFLMNPGSPKISSAFSSICHHHSITPSPHHPITPSPHHPITPSLHHPITPSLHHSITPSLHHSITPSLHHSITPSPHHPITPSLHHSITPHSITPSLPASTPARIPSDPHSEL
jgi:hypothetical protein